MAEIDWNAIIAAIITIASIVIAWWKDREQKQTIAFFTNPVSVATQDSNAVAQKVPERSWKMEDWTKKWICAGESLEDQKDILAQVAKAEEEGLTSYSIHYSKGFYLIEWGLIKASGRDK